jgi:hypothetical protein
MPLWQIDHRQCKTQRQRKSCQTIQADQTHSCEAFQYPEKRHPFVPVDGLDAFISSRTHSFNFYLGAIGL